MSLDDLKIKGRVKAVWWLKDKFRRYKVPVVATVLAGALGLYGLVSSYRNITYKENLFQKYASAKGFADETKYEDALDLLTILKEELREKKDPEFLGLYKNVERLESMVSSQERTVREELKAIEKELAEYRSESAQNCLELQKLKSNLEECVRKNPEFDESECLAAHVKSQELFNMVNDIRCQLLALKLESANPANSIRHSSDKPVVYPIVFTSDNFSGDRGSWKLGIIDSSLGKDNCSYNISNGTLTLTAGWSSTPLALIDNIVRNATIEVDAQLVSSSYKPELVCAGICARVPEGDLRNMRDMLGFNIRSGVGEKNTLFSRNGSKSMGKSTFAPNIEIGRWYHLKMDLIDNCVRCYIDGKLIFDEVLPEGSVPDKGRVGFYCNGSEVSRYDNFYMVLRD